MMIRLSGGRVVDPVNEIDDVRDLWVSDGRIVAAPLSGRADEKHDISGKIVMAGGIDIHTHVAGVNVNLARMLLPEEARNPRRRLASLPFSGVDRSTFETGYLYAMMGYTTVVEPAVSPTHALHAHLELADIPILDTAALLILGNDDYLLGLLREGASRGAVQEYVGLTIADGKGLGIKCINAGGAAAFKENVRAFSLDDVVPAYGVTSREIASALQDAVDALGIPHPLHLHCNNLGIAGNAETAIATLEALGQRRLHLAHLQFYGYGREGARGFSSAAPALAETLRACPNVTIDVGQVMFGPTVTVSSDVLRQFEQRGFARPRKWVIWEGEANGGGMLPVRYSEKSFTSAVQWAVGLELFLLITDPWRVFFTTDHPNGAPFTRYPELFHLLMSAEERGRWLARLPAHAREVTVLSDLRREYTLSEIAVMTRAAPARLLGLPDRGHLGAGAIADIAVYNNLDDRTEMFRAAHLVLKRGQAVVRDGIVVATPPGRTLTLRTEADAAARRRLGLYCDGAYGLSPQAFTVDEDMVGEVMGRGSIFEDVPCRS